jgi:hypothetical protein
MLLQCPDGLPNLYMLLHHPPLLLRLYHLFCVGQYVIYHFLHKADELAVIPGIVVDRHVAWIPVRGALAECIYYIVVLLKSSRIHD